MTRFLSARKVVVVAVLFVVLVSQTGVGWASPIDDKRRQAEALAGQIAANGDRISALGEQFDQAQLELDQAQASLADTRSRVAATQTRLVLTRQELRGRAADMYVRGVQRDPLFDVLGASTLSDAVLRSGYMQTAARHDQDLSDLLRALGQDEATNQQASEVAVQAAQAQADRLTAARREVERAVANQNQLLAKVNGEMADLVRKAQAERDRVARERAARATQAAPRRLLSTSGAFPDVPAPSPGAAAAIAYARAQLGKPYVYAASGPDTFDCSGLTMMAWRAGGVTLVHYSGAQFTAFPQVPLDQLQPGDLVFKGPGGSAHVAIYVGAGMEISATHTGDFVRLQPVPYGQLSGAVRPR